LESVVLVSDLHGVAASPAPHQAGQQGRATSDRLLPCQAFRHLLSVLLDRRSDPFVLLPRNVRRVDVLDQDQPAIGRLANLPRRRPARDLPRRVGDPLAIGKRPGVGGILQEREQHRRVGLLPEHATGVEPRGLPAVDANRNVYIADTLGTQNPQDTSGGGAIRLVGGGTGTVTVEPFASIAPGNTRVFMMGEPTGVGRRKAQGIDLALADIANASTAALRSSYALSTPPNRAGKVKKIGINRVTFDSANNIVRIFPKTTLNAPKTYRLIILGQSVSPVTLFFNRVSILSETV
jgi:hypothetical protein